MVAPDFPGDFSLCCDPFCGSCRAVAGKRMGGVVCLDRGIIVRTVRDLSSGTPPDGMEVAGARRQPADRVLSRVAASGFLPAQSASQRDGGSESIAVIALLVHDYVAQALLPVPKTSFQSKKSTGRSAGATQELLLGFVN